MKRWRDLGALWRRQDWLHSLESSVRWHSRRSETAGSAVAVSASCNVEAFSGKVGAIYS
jgi:hypothetical protein